METVFVNGAPYPVNTLAECERAAAALAAANIPRAPVWTGEEPGSYTTGRVLFASPGAIPCAVRARAALRDRVRTALLTVESCALDDESDFERVLDAVVSVLEPKQETAALDATKLHEDFHTWIADLDPERALDAYDYAHGFAAGRGFGEDDACDFGKAAQKMWFAEGEAMFAEGEAAPLVKPGEGSTTDMFGEVRYPGSKKR
jgi:hypothetical protein